MKKKALVLTFMALGGTLEDDKSAGKPICTRSARRVRHKDVPHERAKRLNVPSPRPFVFGLSCPKPFGRASHDPIRSRRIGPRGRGRLRCRFATFTVTIGLALSGMAGIAHAQDSAKAGKTKSAPCANCHGVDGNSSIPMFPKIAGQHLSYLVRQLHAYKDGKRINPIMQPIIEPLSEQDIADLSAFYSAQKIALNSAPSSQPAGDKEESSENKNAMSPEEFLTLGKKIYESGNVESGLSACIACHGPAGMGNKPAGFPVVKAQHADYLRKSLQDFKLGMRGDDFSEMMQMIAMKMTDQEMLAVAAYIANMK